MEKTEFLIKRKYKEFTIKDVETLLDIFKYNYCLFETGITPQNTYNYSYNYKGVGYKKPCWKEQKSNIKNLKTRLKAANIPAHFAYIKFYKKNNDEAKALVVGKTNINDPDFEFAQFASSEEYSKCRKQLAKKALYKSPANLSKIWLYEKNAISEKLGIKNAIFEKKATWDWDYEKILIFWKLVSDNGNVSFMALQAEADIGGLLGLFHS